MDLHGVGESDVIRRANMVKLHELVKNADKILNY
ncbi:MAG: hypothetical protein CVU73_12310 [Deltaproteobacteria bacterium HGW-Deltaproteobacteria-8]|jgi:hypothetical protein|nr:MAG: hypothetical protein CVU73_12310 [Deltaproteobacteria bacterium HGW-Deltaproteobacteria-8]